MSSIPILPARARNRGVAAHLANARVALSVSQMTALCYGLIFLGFVLLLIVLG